jgi:hypothetical protein
MQVSCKITLFDSKVDALPVRGCERFVFVCVAQYEITIACHCSGTSVDYNRADSSADSNFECNVQSLLWC